MPAGVPQEKAEAEPVTAVDDTRVDKMEEELGYV